MSEGEAAAATLLSFRYPQPASSTPAPYNDYDDGDDGGGEYDSVSSGEGLSVCGALFAILLSVCPLLGYREGCGLQGV